MKKTIIALFLLWFPYNSFALENLNSVDIHGFLSQGYLITTENNYYFSDTKDGTFQFNEMGLNFGKDLTDSLRIGIQFFAKDLGVLGNDKVTIDYAMADYNYRDWLGLRVGKIKKAHGLYNQTRDVDAGRLSIFLPQSVYHEAYREQQLTIKGLSLYGRLFEQLDYHAYYGVIDIPIESGLSYFMSFMVNAAFDIGLSDAMKALISSIDMTPSSYDIKSSPGIVVLWNTPLPGLNLGGSYTTFDFRANTAAVGIDVDGYQALGSVEYTYGNFMFAGEFLLQDNNASVPQFISMSYTSENYYASAAYRLTDWFEFGGGYSVYCFNNDNRDDPNWYLKDAYLSLRFDINNYWIFKLEGHSMDGLMLVSDPDPSEDWQMFAAKVTYSF